MNKTPQPERRPVHRGAANGPCVLVAISHHGFGHLAQIAPVVNELVARQACRVVVYSQLSRVILNAFFQQNGEPLSFEHVDDAIDLNMCMHDAVRVDAAASFHAYAKWLTDHAENLAYFKQRFSEIQPDLVIGNVPPLTFRAAHELQIPSVLIGSLHWAGVFAQYCGEIHGAQEIIQQLRSDYACADQIIALTPGMEFTDVIRTEKIRRVGPVGRIGQADRATFDEHYGTQNYQLILVSMGGMSTPIAYETWPKTADRTYVIAGSQTPDRVDMIALDECEFDYLTVLCSADAFITKVGYGALVEAACNGIPTLYLPRGDWPEEPFSIPWFKAHAVCSPIDAAQLQGGLFQRELNALLDQPRKAAVKVDGAKLAANLLQKYF